MKLIANKALKKEQAIALKTESMTRVCIECNNVFIAKSIRGKCCSNECAKKVSNRRRETLRRMRIIDNGDKDWSITIDKLVDIHNGVCKLCNNLIDKDDYYYNHKGVFIAGNNYPSIDHIYPLSKGGTHTWDNIQLAHRSCNSRKGNAIAG